MPDKSGDAALLSTDYREDLVKGLPDCGVYLIQDYEDLFLSTYPDPGRSDGIPITGGWGTTKDWDGVTNLRLGDTRTEKEWTDLFFHQLKTKYWPEIVQLIPDIVNQHICVQGAMLSLIYNGGSGMISNPKGKYNTTSKVLKSLDLDAIAEQILFINRGGDGSRMLGLFRRRITEARMFKLTTPPLRTEIPDFKAESERIADGMWSAWKAKHGN